MNGNINLILSSKNAIERDDEMAIIYECKLFDSFH